MKITNLTPHVVVVLADDPNGPITGFTGIGKAATEGKFALVAEFQPAGPVARAAQRDEVVGTLEIGGTQVTLIRSAFGTPTDLPAAEDGMMHIVSILTAQAAKAAGRTTDDLLVTADTVRDQTGKIIGCRRFALL